MIGTATIPVERRRTPQVLPRALTACSVVAAGGGVTRIAACRVGVGSQDHRAMTIISVCDLHLVFDSGNYRDSDVSHTGIKFPMHVLCHGWGRFQRHDVVWLYVGDTTPLAIAQQVVLRTVTQKAALWAVFLFTLVSDKSCCRFLGLRPARLQK